MSFEVGFALIIVVVAVVAIAASVLLNADRRLKRRIRQLPAAETIALTPENQDVRVSGTLAYVEGKPPLTAPISNRACVAWRVVVQEQRSNGKSTYWHEIMSESDSTDFALEDESGRAIVDGTALTLALDFDASSGQGLFNPATAELQAFMDSRGIADKGLFLKKTIRAREGVLELGETVTVAGHGTLMNDSRAQSGYRGNTKLLHLKALSTGELLVSDDLKLGQKR